jgi:hypothetical protein
MVSRQDHTIRADHSPDHDPAANGHPDQPTSAADLAQPPGNVRGGPTTPQQDPDRLEVTTDNVRRTGAEISNLRGSVRLNPVDTSNVTTDVVGHAGLTHALQDFIEYWHNELGTYAAHLDDTGQQLELSASHYRATDDAAADTLSALDPDSSRPAAEQRDRTR